MWLLFSTDPVLTEFDAKGENLKSLAQGLREAFDVSISAENTLRTLTAIDSEAKKLSRTIASGIVVDSGNFRDRLFQIQNNVNDIGGSFQDVVDVVTDLNAETGKLTLPSEQATIQTIELAKATNQTAKEAGKMVGTFMSFTKGQKTAVNEMAKIAKIARQSGVEAKTLLTSISADLAKLDKYNFKSGSDGLTKMSAEAQRLGTTLSEIGVFDIADKLVDPENAVETAANLSMLGGSVEGLTNPFQLMGDAANNVENLQSKLIDLAKSAFKIDETTGAIETNFVAQQRLKSQVEALGGNYDNFLKLGRAAAKEQLVLNKLISSGVDTSKISEDQMNLVKSLTEVGEGGKLELRIPGFETENLAKTLKDDKGALTSALEKYQEMASKTDRELAEQSITIEESQAADIRAIRDTVMRGLSPKERNKLIEDSKKIQSGVAEEFKKGAEKLKSVPTEVLTGFDTVVTEFTDAAKSSIPSDEDVERKLTEEKKQAREQSKATIIPPTMDAIFGDNNNKVLTTGKGEIFNFIKEDEAVFAPDAIKNIGVLKETYLKFMGVSKSLPSEVKLIEPPTSDTSKKLKQQIETTSNIVTTNKNEDTVNVNINLNIDGKSLPSNLADMLFKNPATVRDLENKVLDVLDKKDILRSSKGRYNKR
jgi:hypothetical protein